MSRLGADVLLLTTAGVWGVTFVVQKDIGHLPPLAFVAARFAVSGLAVAPLAFLEGRARGFPLRSARGRWRSPSLGASLQQAGLATTSATNGGFLTACYVVLTPFVVWTLSGARPRAIVLAAGAVSLAGAWLLAAGGGPARPPTIGDGLVLMSDLAWATQIALTPIYLGRTERPLSLAFSQYAVCSALAAAASVVFETAEAGAFLAAAPAILFAGLVSGGLGYTLQIVGQHYTPPAEAAYSAVAGEPVRRACGIGPAPRAADPRRRRGPRAHSCRRGGRRTRAGACEPKGSARLNATLRGEKAEPLRRPSALPQH